MLTRCIIYSQNDASVSERHRAPLWDCTPSLASHLDQLQLVAQCTSISNPSHSGLGLVISSISTIRAQTGYGDLYSTVIYSTVHPGFQH